MWYKLFSHRRTSALCVTLLNGCKQHFQYFTSIRLAQIKRRLSVFFGQCVPRVVMDRPLRRYYCQEYLGYQGLDARPCLRYRKPLISRNQVVNSSYNIVIITRYSRSILSLAIGPQCARPSDHSQKVYDNRKAIVKTPLFFIFFLNIYCMFFIWYIVL